MFPVIPKQIQSKHSFIRSLFLNQNLYNVSNELFTYLIYSPFLYKQFPFLENEHDMNANTMALHVYLTQEKIRSVQKSKKEADQFLFCCQTYQFIDFAKKYNDEYPVEDIQDYFVENYTNRVKILGEQIKLMQSYNIGADREEKIKNYEQLIRKYIFLNKFPEGSTVLRKFYLYYAAHQNYLDGLSYEHIMQNKIYWGLMDDFKLLEQ